MTKEAARNLLKTHWTATGKIQSMNDEQFANFSECFPTVDLRSGFTQNLPPDSHCMRSSLIPVRELEWVVLLSNKTVVLFLITCKSERYIPDG